MSTTWNPSLQPTFVPTKADLMPSTLVLGMGVGTFTTIVMAVVLLFVFCLSGPCDVEKKLVWRIVSVLVCTLVFLILLYAPREPLYETSEPLTTIYDYSIIPRITVSCIMILFAIIAGVMLFANSKEPIELSTLQHDMQAFWQDE